MFVQKTVIYQEGNGFDITGEIVRAVKESGIKEGLCCVTALSEHTGIVCVPEKRQEILADIWEDLERILPPRTNYKDSSDPARCAGRSKAALTESSKDFIIHEGEVQTWGNVYLLPFSQEEEGRYAIACCG